MQSTCNFGLHLPRLPLHCIYKFECIFPAPSIHPAIKEKATLHICFDHFRFFCCAWDIDMWGKYFDVSGNSAQFYIFAEWGTQKPIGIIRYMIEFTMQSDISIINYKIRKTAISAASLHSGCRAYSACNAASCISISIHAPRVGSDSVDFVQSSQV